MKPQAHAQAKAWLDSVLVEPGLDPLAKPKEFERLWRGFMTARVALGFGLLLFQGVIYALGSARDSTLILICSAYCFVTLGLRLISRKRPLGKAFEVQWMAISGVDMLAFAALQIAQGSSINYAPLLALPVLMASVLGSLLLAMAGAACVTLLLFVYAAWMSFQAPADATALFLQAALTGAGCFAVAFLANQIAIRLANVELLAQRSQLAVRVQRQVNALVIESLTDGVLVVDPSSTVRAANPAARRLLGTDVAVDTGSFSLAALVGWQELFKLMKQSFATKSAMQADVTIHHAGQGPRRLLVRTQLTTNRMDDGDRLCVMFLQDQREMEARMRSDKLASMGRMSAAVAHEIRNPLAAIAQANDLLDEDLSDPRHKQLTQMVQQNVRRLGKIVDEVLDISRVQQRENAIASTALELNGAVARICRDWQEQSKCKLLLYLDLSAAALTVQFESEHLRRILVNLLDNAARFTGGQPGAIEVSCSASTSGQAVLHVWNVGQPMDQSVERHLFEPFFSSESRSSGLGLYICRELCEEQGATIAYLRSTREIEGKATEGNEFQVSFQTNRR